MDKGKQSDELAIANLELVFQNKEKEDRAAELVIANTELVFQNKEKEDRAAELVIANTELVFQNKEKEDRAAELVIANTELVFQNKEKEDRAAELVIANTELAFQNKEKEDRAAELVIANIELAFQNKEKENRAAELIIVNKQQEFDGYNLNALINNTSDLMWSVDKEFKLITSNQPFNQLMKHISGYVIEKGNNILAAGFQPQQLERFKKNYQRAFAGETFTEVEFTDVPFDLWTEISYYPIRNGDDIIGTACHSHDITKSKHDELERTKITNDLIQRNRDLEQFTFIISHNLRAPTANIIGFADNLQDETLAPDEQKQLLDGLSQSVLKLDVVIRDLNAILQVKREISEKRESISFSKLVSDICISVGNLIDKYHVQIKTDFSEVDEIYSLKGYIYSIFYNLISNSIKYRKQNEQPIIEISSRKLNDRTVLTFKDNGLGIDMKTKGDKVFGLYKRFHTHVEGKGIGLFMVKTQVESLGGKISLLSEPNKGTEFTIEFEVPLKSKNESKTVSDCR